MILIKINVNSKFYCFMNKMMAFCFPFKSVDSYIAIQKHMQL